MNLEESISAASSKVELESIEQELSAAMVLLTDKIRRMSFDQTVCDGFTSYDGSRQLQRSVQVIDSPWAGIELEAVDIPGMITDEEAQYYNYISDFYTGQGNVIELGPWLGKSTYYIAKALLRNPNYEGRTLKVYDDFVWRPDWMNDYVPEDERLKGGEDFQFLFEKYTSDVSSHVDVKKRKFVTYDGNDNVEQLKWDGDPIEIMYIDCGRTIEANEAWYSIFSNSFIPGKTLLIMQDWRLHRQLPVQWYNQTKIFTDSKMAQLEMIHELLHGDIAPFIWHG
jgi:hypothetical protein